MNSSFSKPIVTLFLSFFLFLQIGLSQNKIDKATAQKIDEQFAQQQKGNIPAAAIVVVKDGAIIYQKAFGNSNLEHEVPANTATKFLMADLFSQFVAYGILLLEQEGKLSVEEDMRKYLTDFPDYGQTIKIRNLLMHQHGLFDCTTLQNAAAWGSTGHRPHRQIVNLMKMQPQLMEIPGEGFNYSTTGFILAAEIIERITGESFPVFAQKKIFAPLGMTNSFFQENPNLIVKNKGSVYRANGDDFQYNEMSYHTTPVSQFYASVEDLGKWMLHFQGKGVAVQKINTEFITVEGEELRLGFGQFLEESNGIKRINQNGLAYGNLTFMARFPEHDFGVAVLSNNSSFNSRGAALATAELLLKDQMTIEPEAEVAETGPTQTTYKKLSHEHLTSFVGHYWNEDYFYNREILLRNDTLIYSRGGQESLLGAIDDHTFGIYGRDDARFVFGEKDGKKTMVLHFSGYEYHYDAYEPVVYSGEDLAAFTGTFYSKELETTYRVEVKKNQLVFNNMRVEDIAFEPINNDVFVSGTWWFSNVVFEKNKGGKVTGFRLSTGDVKELLFEKI